MSNEVAQPCAEHLNMELDWNLVDHLRGGTRAMREAGETYLPKRPMEEASDWEARRKFATLFPTFQNTSRANTGRVFANPIMVNDDVPQWIVDDVLSDIDLHGRDFHVWARDWFNEGFDYGVSHVLVESPEVSPDIKTKQQQTDAKIRPYAIRIHPRNVIGWRFKDGQLVQLRVRFWRQDESSEFDVQHIEQIRVYDLVGVRVFEKVGDVWTQIGVPVVTNWKKIPLVSFYTNRTGPLQAVPPMRELAYLNAKHFRIQSSLDTLVETASVPILYVAGVNDDTVLVIGAKSAVKLPLGGEIAYCEHSGAAIGAGKASLDGLVEEMRQIGAKLLAPPAGSKSGGSSTPSAKTATQVSEEAARDNSILGAMAIDFQGACKELLDMIASFRGEEKGGTVKVQANLDPDLDPNTTMATVTSMEAASIVSKQTVYERAQDMGVIPDDVTWEDEQQRIKDDMLAMPPPPAPVIVPGEKPPTPGADPQPGGAA